MIAQSEIEKLKESVSLLALVEEELGPPAKTYQDTHAWCCPLHDDDNPSFHVYLSTNTFSCFGCGASGDIYAWMLMRNNGMKFHQAHKLLKANAKPEHRRSVQRPPAERKTKQPPNDKWQTEAQKFVERCQRELWGGYGKNALDELRRRGLSDETIGMAGLGYNSQAVALRPEEWGFSSDMEMKVRWVGQGITIPWYMDGKLQAVNRRQQLDQHAKAQGWAKYVLLPGSTKGLYTVSPIEPTRPVALVEGEFDALTMHQEAGDLVTAVATGGAPGARSQPWIEMLSRPPLVLLCFDADAPGDMARDYWLKVLPNAKPFRPWFEDVNAMHQKGFPIRKWIEDRLKSKR